MIDAAHSDPLLCVAELNLDLAAKRVMRGCQCKPKAMVRPVAMADALAMLEVLARAEDVDLKAAFSHRKSKVSAKCRVVPTAWPPGN